MKKKKTKYKSKKSNQNIDSQYEEIFSLPQDHRIKEHFSLLRLEIKKNEIKLNSMDNEPKVDEYQHIFVDDNMIINKNVLDIIGNELMCPICNGLLSDPISCSNCETSFCKICIEKWKTKNSICVMKCPAPLELKNVNRMTKIMLEKLILKCQNCDEEVSLIQFPNHSSKCNRDDSVSQEIVNVIEFQKWIYDKLNDIITMDYDDQKKFINKLIKEQKQSLPYCGHSSSTKDNVLCHLCKKDDKLVKMETELKKFNNINELTMKQILLGVNESQTCDACYEKIKRDSDSIQCNVCYSIQHYKCINNQDIDYCECGYCNNATILCKKCKFYFFITDCIKCYCCKNFYLFERKVFKAYDVITTLEEKCSGYSSKGIERPLTENNINKSCGLICGKELCGDKKCELICHPGPHLSCESHTILTCHCGQKKYEIKKCEFSGDKTFLTCGKICGKKICSKHLNTCTFKCHPENGYFEKITSNNNGHSKCLLCINQDIIEPNNNSMFSGCFLF